MTDLTTSRLGPLAAFVGTWSGEGQGIYPTIATFGYREQITFTDGGVKPFVAYAQRTSALDDGRPLHAETGYLRWAEESPEWIIASPTGVTEVSVGSVTVVAGGVDLHVRTASVSLSPTAKLVESVERIVRLRGDVLEYELHMAAVGEPHQLHLTASLRRDA
jgi:THAP4-like, heme-binding beta-barrel domain